MAKAVMVTYGDSTVSFSPTRVDRSKIYGARKRIAVDGGGRDCTRASLTADGSQLLLIFPKYMTTDRSLMRYISIGLIGDDGHGKEAVGRSNKEAVARRAHVAGGQAPRRSGVGGGRCAPDGVHMEGAAR